MKRFVYLTLLLAIFFVGMVGCVSQGEEEDIEYKELYRIQVGGKFGFINEKGELLIEPQFDIALPYFSDDVCYALIGENGERRGLIDTNGDFILELDSSILAVGSFKNNLAIYATNNGRVGIINKNGEVIISAIYKNVRQDGNNGFIVEDTLGNQGYVNNQGDFIVPCKYDAVNGFNEGLMVVATSDKCGYVDTTGVWVIDSIYDDARGFGDGLARVLINDKWTFIDRKGNVIDELNYDEILTGFANNRAFVKDGNTIKLINKRGRKIAEIDADSVYGFYDGYATFQKNGKFGKIDTTGIVTIQPRFEKLYVTVNGASVFEREGKYGVVDTVGHVIVEAIYDEIIIRNEQSLYTCGNKDLTICTYYDKEGNLIWKDMQGAQFSWPEKPTKSDFIAYFDSRLSELDPIEGIYYTTFNRVAVNRNNGHSSSNGSSSKFYAVIRNPIADEFIAYNIDYEYLWECWVKKFVQIGESNNYAVVNVDKSSNWAEDGRLVLEDPYKFEVSLRTGGNNYYNWYVQCEFIKDYPSSEVYEQVQKAEWSGSGFAIAEGYIVTNYHVTNGAKTIHVRGVHGKTDESYRGYLVATDKEHDLAIIKIVDKKFNGIEDIPYRIGKTIPEVGDEVFVLGYPMTDTMGDDVKLTDGIISAASGYKGDQSMYQISAAVQPGNSGGPLFDNDGNVIGIVCAKHADAENANYAIKASYLLSLINKSNLGIKLPDNNKVKSKSLSKKVKQVKPFVYIIECNSH